MGSRLWELAALFLKLGIIGFGGPAAHLALFEHEVVVRRQWLTREQFLDYLGVTNLIPGPNSTEMAMQIGYLRAGYPGLLVAGACFILPAALITTACAWAYVRFGARPQAAHWLAGIKPAILAIILAAVWRLGKTAVKNRLLLGIGVAVLVASLYGANEVLALLLGGALGMWWLREAEIRRGKVSPLLVAYTIGLALAVYSAILMSARDAPLGATGAQRVELWPLALFFLKVGSVLYGGGYVLIALLEQGLVRGHGWLTQRQLLDAIAIGQVTPGPVLSTATCVGYLLARGPGAAIATVAIFLPSFVFVAALGPIVPRLRRSPWVAAFLDAVNVSAVALMAATLPRFLPARADWDGWLLTLVAVIVALRWRINAAWLVLGGATLGWLLRA